MKLTVGANCTLKDNYNFANYFSTKNSIERGYYTVRNAS